MNKLSINTPVTEKKLRDILKDYPTKNDLKKELSNYATKEDLKKELSNYPTKDDLDKRFIAFHKAFSSEMDYKFNFFREEIREDSSKFANLILTAIDPLMKKLETRREDREITTAQIEEVRSRIKNHEKRITKLEHV